MVNQACRDFHKQTLFKELQPVEESQDILYPVDVWSAEWLQVFCVVLFLLFSFKCLEEVDIWRVG